MLGSLSNDVFERHMATGSGLFAPFSRYSMRVKALSKFFTNLIASRHIKRGKNSLPVDAPGFEESAHLPSLNECRSTSESKQSLSLGFLQEIYGEDWPETTKDYFNVSNWSLSNKNLTCSLWINYSLKHHWSCFNAASCWWNVWEFSEQ